MPAPGAGQPLTGIRFMVPNTAGGGYDTTARAAAKVMDETDVTKNVEVFNLAGAGGTVGLSRTVSEKGNGQLLMMMGLGVVGAQYTNKSEAKLDQTTPIAKLIEESGAIVVPKNSPYQTINDLVAAWKADPKAMAVGGGSSPGGPDHLLPMQLAQAVGIDPKEVNFISYDGGGELLPALLGGKIAFGASGFGEFLDQVEAGEVRVLAISGAERVDAHRRPDLEGVRDRPGVHQLARRGRSPGDLRRRQGRPGRRADRDARPARSGRTCWPRTAGPTPS